MSTVWPAPKIIRVCNQLTVIAIFAIMIIILFVITIVIFAVMIIIFTIIMITAAITTSLALSSKAPRLPALATQIILLAQLRLGVVSEFGTVWAQCTSIHACSLSRASEFAPVSHCAPMIQGPLLSLVS